MKKTLLAGLALVACAASAHAQAAATAAPATPAAAPVRQQLPADSLELARKFVQWMWSNQVDSLLAHSPASERTPQNRQEMADGIVQMAAQVGQETQVIEEKWVRRNGNRQYWRTARFTDFTAEPLVLRVVILPNGDLAGIGLNPLSQVPPIDPEP